MGVSTSAVSDHALLSDVRLSAGILPLQSGRWYFQPVLSNYANASQALAANFLYSWVVNFPAPTSIEAIGVGVITASAGNAKLAIHKCGTDGYPAALIAQGTVSTATTGDKTVSGPWTLHGRYAFSVLCSGSPGLRALPLSYTSLAGLSGLSNPTYYSGWLGSYTYADLPDPYPSSISFINQNQQSIAFRG